MTDMQQEKFGFKAAIGGTGIILFSLMALFGGIDISSLIAILAIIFLIALFVKKDFAGFANNTKGALAFYVPFAALILYVVGMRQYHGLSFNSTSQELIGTLVAFPLVAWGILGQGFDKIVLKRATVAGFLILISFLAIEGLDGYKLYHMATPNQVPTSLEVNLGRGAFISLAFFWPALLAAKSLKLDIKIFIFMFIAAAFVSTRFGIDLNMGIFVIGLLAAGFTYKFPKTGLTIVFSVAIILLAFAPFIYGFISDYSISHYHNHMPISYERRAMMWGFAVSKIHENPIFGLGLDSSRNFEQPVELGGFIWATLQMHTHSAPIHIWFEGGAIGAGLAILTVIGAAIVIFRNKLVNKDTAWAYAAAISSLMIGWALSYSFWSQWLWGASLFVICSLFNASNLLSEEKAKITELVEL